MVDLDPLQLIVHGYWVSETPAGSASTSKALTRGPRRSLRIAYLADIASLQHPWYHLILFGEPGYFRTNQPHPPDGYRIIIIDSDDKASDY